ncbi:MAG: fimbrillin family protein [Prevotella sp.]|nr:fimbrillin family protein [Prevotella sp.]
MRYITGKFGCCLLAVGCWLLAVGCSSDHADEQRAVSTLQVVPYTTVYQNIGHLMRAVTEGYSEYTPDHDLAIGLYVLPEETPTVKLIRYSSGVWHSQAVVEGSHDYTIYGFMPKKDPITSSISQSGGNVLLTLSNIPAVTADDVCLVTGVKDITGALQQGQFDYRGKVDDNHVRLLMDHLFAAVKFQFAVDADYRALRIIKLKSLTLTTTSAAVTAAVTLTPNTTGADPVTSVSYTPSGSTSSATFFENAAGVDITAAEIGNYPCCFAPALSSNLTMVSTYDVYDRYGNKVREDCTATNSLPNLSAARGQCVTINLTVAPTYLGVLSDPDIDNPTFTVN